MEIVKNYQAQFAGAPRGAPGAPPGWKPGPPGSALPSVGSVRFKNDIFEPPAARPEPVPPWDPWTPTFFGVRGPQREIPIVEGESQIGENRDFSLFWDQKPQPNRYQGGPRQKLADGVF